MRDFPTLTTISLSLRMVCMIGLLGVGLQGCPPAESPHQKENQQLLKKVAKQESLITTLQEGNRVLQEQIDRLNQEIRTNQAEFERQLEEAHRLDATLSTDRDKMASLADTLQKKHQKLLRDAQWLRAQRDQFREALFAQVQKAQTEVLPHPFAESMRAATQALHKHGYPLKASMHTDRKAVYVTERKISKPTALELTGFRNQYLVLLEQLSKNETKLSVQAEFEKVAKNGAIIPAGPDEIREIEWRLIQEIDKMLKAPPTAQVQ